MNLYPWPILLLILFGTFANAQNKEIIPDVSKITDPNIWIINDRTSEEKGEIYPWDF